MRGREKGNEFYVDENEGYFGHGSPLASIN